MSTSWGRGRAGERLWGEKKLQLLAERDRGALRAPAALSRDVLARVAEGVTNREIADRLVMSVRTVDHACPRC